MPPAANIPEGIAPLSAPNESSRHALWLLSGLGFALGFGWMWSTSLQEFWLPRFLWGGLFSGGGTSLFVGLALACFGLAGSVLRYAIPRYVPKIPNGEAEDFRAGKIPNLLHASALGFVGLALFAAQGGSPYVAAGCLALAGVILGIYWTAAILVLPGWRSLAAFAVACGFSAILVLLHNALPWDADWVLAIELLAAWAAAGRLGQVLRHLRMESELTRLKTPEPKRARGRPAQRTAQQVEELLPEKLPRPFIMLPVLIFFMTGFAQAGLAYGAAGAEKIILPQWTSQSIEACGAALVFLLYALPGGGTAPEARNVRFPILICAAFAMLGIVSLLLPGLLPLGIVFVEGAACGALFALLATTPPEMLLPAPAFRHSALTRAAFLLGSAALCTHAGIISAGIAQFFRPAAPLTLNWMAITTGVAALLLAGALGAAIRLGLRGLASSPGGNGSNEILVLLSEREYTIADLVIQGLSNKDISASLFISEDTVRFHLKRIYQKTGLSDRESLRALGRDDTA